MLNNINSNLALYTEYLRCYNAENKLVSAKQAEAILGVDIDYDQDGTPELWEFMQKVNEVRKQEIFQNIEGFKKDTEVPSKAKVYFMRCIEYMSVKDYVSALKDCNEKIALEPKDSTAYSIRSEIYENLGEEILSLEDMVSFYKLSGVPQYNVYKAQAEVHEAKGYKLYKSGKVVEAANEYSEAVADYEWTLANVFDEERKTEVRINLGRAYYNYGTICLKLERYTDAEKALIQTLLYLPDHAAATKNLNFVRSKK